MERARAFGVRQSSATLSGRGRTHGGPRPGVDDIRGRVHFPGMSTVAEIERAIGHLPPEQWTEIRRWMDAHAPKAIRGADMAEFDVWLAASTGIAKGKLTTDERMRETRGEA